MISLFKNFTNVTHLHSSIPVWVGKGWSYSQWTGNYNPVYAHSHSDHGQSACTAGTWVGPLSREEPLEKGVATHTSILAWRIPWTEEPGGLEDPMDRGAWWAIVHGVEKSQTRLSNWHVTYMLTDSREQWTVSILCGRWKRVETRCFKYAF